MRIRAIRMAEVGPFEAGVALEGLSGGLDVLVGRNELGKSTLFRGLCTLLADKHTSVGQRVQALRPDRGGAPLVEAEIEIDGRLWRVTKRFLAQRMAELRELGSGRLYRGADAEARLAELLAQGGREALRPLMWVAQADSFTLPAQQPGLEAALTSLVEIHATDASGEGLARRVGARVAERLSEQLSDKRSRPRAGSPLARAIERRDALRRELAEAQVRAGAAAERIERLGSLEAEHAALGSQAATAEAQVQIEAARKALADAERARERKRTSEARIAAAELRRNKRQEELAAFERALLEREGAARAAADLEAEIAETAQQADGTARAAEAARQAREALADRLAAARELLARREAADRRHAARKAAEAASARLAVARAAATAVREARAIIAAIRIDEADLGAVRRLHEEVRTLEVEVAAAAPRITIDYLPQAEGRIRVGGRVIAGGEAIRAEGPLDLVIEGVGTVKIEPPQRGREEARQVLEARRLELADGLARMGVDGIGAAEEALEGRRSALIRLSAAEAELRASAPEGLAVLERSLSQAQAPDEGQSDADAALADRTTLEGQVAGLDRELALLDGMVAERRRAEAAARERLVAAEVRRSELERRVGELGRSLPDESAAGVRRGELAASLAAAQTALDAEVRDGQAWSAAAPDADRMDELERRVRQAEDAQRSRERRRGEVAEALAALRSELARDGADGIGAAVAELEEKVGAADADVRELELDVAALQLVGARLEAALAERRPGLLQPVVERVSPLLARLVPGTTTALEGPLAVAGIVRGGRAEQHGQLSLGTREQIAVLVRVAYAGMLADQGMAMPLVLDDALVFSDDDRMASMLRILCEASSQHQVIVLTCRLAALSALAACGGVRRLELEPWEHEPVRKSRVGS